MMLIQCNHNGVSGGGCDRDEHTLRCNLLHVGFLAAIVSLVRAHFEEETACAALLLGAAAYALLKPLLHCMLCLSWHAGT